MDKKSSLDKGRRRGEREGEQPQDKPGGNRWSAPSINRQATGGKGVFRDPPEYVHGAEQSRDADGVGHFPGRSALTLATISLRLSG